MKKNQDWLKTTSLLSKIGYHLLSPNIVFYRTPHPPPLRRRRLWMVPSHTPFLVPLKKNRGCHCYAFEGYEFQIFQSDTDQHATPVQIFQFRIYVFQFWPMRDLVTIIQPFLFFRFPWISLVKSHGPNGQNVSISL